MDRKGEKRQRGMKLTKDRLKRRRKAKSLSYILFTKLQSGEITKQFESLIITELFYV